MPLHKVCQGLIWACPANIWVVFSLVAASIPLEASSTWTVFARSYRCAPPFARHCTKLTFATLPTESGSAWSRCSPLAKIPAGNETVRPQNQAPPMSGFRVFEAFWRKLNISDCPVCNHAALTTTRTFYELSCLGYHRGMVLTALVLRSGKVLSVA